MQDGGRLLSFFLYLLLERLGGNELGQHFSGQALFPCKMLLQAPDPQWSPPFPLPTAAVGLCRGARHVWMSSSGAMGTVWLASYSAASTGLLGASAHLQPVWRVSRSLATADMSFHIL